MEIFSDFPLALGKMTAEEMHKKRLVMEEHIFALLKAKYLSHLKSWWLSYQVPKESDKSIIIVERRIHPNLEFILYNAAYYARDWAITIVCSDINIEYIRSLLGPNLDSVHLIQMFEGNPEPTVGKNEYNYLLQSSEFYEAMQSENLLMMEMDTYLRKPIATDILKYDYVAAPYSWDTSSAGGGLSFRKRSAMLSICSTFTDLCHAQDIYALRGMKSLGYVIPPFDESIQYFCESCHYKDPIGFHQWWTFFSESQEDANTIFQAYMTLEL
jgi:hypothetical protein